MPAIQLAPGLRRLTAPNPSPMTLHGTNSFLIGQTDLGVIDPGPLSEAHLQAILAAVGPGQRISHILVTHSHRDHSPLARVLAQATGAPVLAAGHSDWGRRPVMAALADAGMIGGGEGVEDGFAPDRHLADGEVICADGWQIEALHTPGHMANHLSFAWEDALFTGDLVMGWSTSLISPPDGDLTAFRASLQRLMARADRVFYPAHGDAVTDPQARLAELITHRAGREAEILCALQDGPATPQALVARIYTGLAPGLIPVAERNVLAHLIDLVERNIAAPVSILSATGQFHLK
jgi:glyoxylase-like metal-dependent hydrolase (beta-lactamase superfamily II)